MRITSTYADPRPINYSYSFGVLPQVLQFLATACAALLGSRFGQMLLVEVFELTHYSHIFLGDARFSMTCCEPAHGLINRC